MASRQQQIISNKIISRNFNSGTQTLTKKTEYSLHLKTLHYNKNKTQGFNFFSLNRGNHWNCTLTSLNLKKIYFTKNNKLPHYD
ncbi:hypothetical protein BN1007_71310 [Klebsiella variicola]|nr:hypothetical protein BN1007_71310 [Klebsiella variicola]